MAKWECFERVNQNSWYHAPLRKDRAFGRGGGVALYVASHLSGFVRHSEFEFHNQELFWTEFVLGKIKFICGVCYRPPNSSSEQVNDFFESLQDSLDKINTKGYAAVFLLGDLNAHYNFVETTSCNTDVGIKLYHFLECNNLFQIIGEPTRITPASESILDLIISDSPGLFTHSGTRIVCLHIPYKCVAIRPRDKLWMNGAIRSALKKRDRFLKAFRRTKSPARWENYRRQRNLVVALIRSAKRAHEKKLNDLLSDASTSSKMWWRITKSLYGDKLCCSILPLNDSNTLIANSKKKAHGFNEYFVAQSLLPRSNTSDVPFLPRFFLIDLSKT